MDGDGFHKAVVKIVVVFFWIGVACGVLFAAAAAAVVYLFR